jgi:hypothetical protein
MLVAIHQPNYAPWLGYFAKISRADVFVFLDNVQFSKNNYINRVQIDGGGRSRWLTIPVSHRMGDPIDRVRAANLQWPRSHLDCLRSCYSRAAAWREVSPWLEETYLNLPQDNLAASNVALIEALAAQLGLVCRFRCASEFDTGDATSDDRLIAIVKSLGEGASYLSGRGGAKYQDPAKFQSAGVPMVYSDFVHPTYDQRHPRFQPGLSVLDSLFHVGFERAALLVASPNAMA